MAIQYGTIRSEIELRSSQLSGTDQATLEASYTAHTVDGAEIPVSAIKDQILDIEAELAHIIASDVSHPYRSYIAGTSAGLANLADTPTEDASGNPFIGLFDSVIDGTSGQPLTAQPTQTLLDYQDDFFSDTEFYNFAIMGNTIQHTRTTAKLVGCVWNRETQASAYDADGDSPLPPPLINTWIAGVMANLGQVGWTDPAGVTSTYNGLYQQGIQLLRMGAARQLNLPLASQNPISG